MGDVKSHREGSAGAGSDQKHHVVIIGGGFGGLWAARALKKASVRVTLVDRRNFHLFQPLLYQVATGGLSPADIASPLRSVLSKQKNVKVELGEMVGLDQANRRVLLHDSSLEYDSLIVAVGSGNFYFGNDEWEEHAPGLKGVEDALNIRRKIYAAFEAAERERDEQRRRQLLTFVIVGGGPTGVELAGAIAEIARVTMREDFREIDTSVARVVLLEGGDSILPAFPESLSKAAVESLERLGVEVRAGAMVSKVDEAGVIAGSGEEEERIESDTVMWAAGVKPSPLGRTVVSGDDALLDKTGRVKVTEELTVPGHPDLFVIGDLANFSHQTGKPLPGLAPVAMSQGKYVAKLIDRRLRGKPVEPFHYRNKGNLAVIGRAAAIADFGWARFSGYPAWLIWLFVHIMYLVGYDNRLLVFIQWAWNFITRNRSARLITYDFGARRR